MKRYLSPDKIDRVSKDFSFLVKRIRNSFGELDLRIRDGYFNLYFKGNSLAKVTVKSDGCKVTIHRKFATDDVYLGDSRFEKEWLLRDDYKEFQLSPKLLRPFFQKKYLDKLCRNIARVNYSEEITFEQMLITDNLERTDFIIIDRQVTEPAFRGKKVDLLALRNHSGNKFQFEVIEVKLGKNPELRHDVVFQLNNYLEFIRPHFQDWKISYENTYRQMKRLGLFDLPAYEEIVILPGVTGLIAVGWYSGVAQQQIEELKPYLGDIEVKLFTNNL